jgi:hypothetical protein
MSRTQVVVIGAGQSGLAVSALLTAAAVDHVVVERGRTAQRWHAERWASLRLLTPNWMTRLPGWAYRGGRSGRIPARHRGRRVSRRVREVLLGSGPAPHPGALRAAAGAATASSATPPRSPRTTPSWRPRGTASRRRDMLRRKGSTPASPRSTRRTTGRQP